MRFLPPFFFFFFFNDPAPTEIYPLPLHDALPISSGCRRASSARDVALLNAAGDVVAEVRTAWRGPGLLAHPRLVPPLLLVLGRGALGVTHEIGRAHV